MGDRGGRLSNAVGLSDFSRDPALAHLADLALIGVFGGFYIVPLYALIQSRGERSHQSRMIAGNNILNALFMVVSAVMAVALFKRSFTIPQLFGDRAAERGGRRVHLYARPGIPDAVHGMAADPFVYRREKSGSKNSGKWTGGIGMQPREFRRCVDHRRRVPQADPAS